MSVFKSCLILCLILGFSVKAQQESIQALYPFMGESVNPAFAGQDSLVLKAFFRRKPFLKNFGQQINQQFLYVGIPNKMNGMGFGIMVSNLSNSFGYINGGISSNFSVGGSVSNHWELGKGISLNAGGNYSINQFPFLSSNGASVIRGSFGLGMSLMVQSWEIAWALPSKLTKGDINRGVGNYQISRLNYLFPRNDFGQLKLGLARVKKYGQEGKFDFLMDYELPSNWKFGFYYLGSGGDVFRKSILGAVRYQAGRRLTLGYSFDFGSTQSASYRSVQNPGGSPSGFHLLFVELKP